MSDFRACVVVPCYNHPRVISRLVGELAAEGVSVIVVDDGSDEPSRGIVASLHDPDKAIYTDRLPFNQGKGAAVIRGFEMARDLGFTHVAQIDADGQHDLASLKEMLSLSQKHPDDLISGKPVYDHSIPTGRKIGRWITHVWVWIETLSLQIKDSMCGFRVYPLKQVFNLLEKKQVGLRMDFDTEIMVRLYWDGVDTRHLPVAVNYPEENTSNFQVVQDNIRISKMHTKLVFEMLPRIPSLIWRHIAARHTAGQTGHWAKLDERGMYWGICFLAGIYRFFGARICFVVMQPILLYFFLSKSLQRRASLTYLTRVFKQRDKGEVANWITAFRHFQEFGYMALEKLAVWTGGIDHSAIIFPEDSDFESIAHHGKGAVVFTSHLGNIEIARALSTRFHQVKITVFAHTGNAIKFNRMLTRYNPKAAINMVEVTELGPATAIDMEQRLVAGEWIVIAADRIPVDEGKRISDVEFLGKDAPFPQGGFILASLLKAPTYMMLCMKDGARYQLVFDKLADRVVLPRKSRNAAILKYQQQYAAFLEKYCLRYPYQWFNFFDFWGEDR